MKIEATRAFLHLGQVVNPLDVLEVPNDLAAALIHADKARKHTEPAEPAPVAETEPEAPKRAKKEATK